MLDPTEVPVVLYLDEQLDDLGIRRPEFAEGEPCPAFCGESTATVATECKRKGRCPASL